MTENTPLIPTKEDDRDEENLINHLLKEEEVQDYQSIPKQKQILKGKKKRIDSLIVNYFKKSKLVKNPEWLLLLIALLLTVVWFQMVCIIKHDHAQMIIMAQKSIHHISLIDIHKSQTDLQPENIQDQKLDDSKSESEDETSWEKKEIVKSLKDKKIYKLKKLENGLKVLMISDKEGQQSFMSMDVRAGSWQDKAPGTAHFLEHMKFRSLDDSGEQNQLQNLLSQFQGSANAFTEAEHTSFHLNVSNEGFDQSLDAFRQMFTSQSYSKDSVLLEVNAVNSEFVNTLTSDGWKIQYLLMDLAKADHPQKQFHCGSNESLLDESIDILKEVEQFDKSYYSADLMTFVVLSNKSIEELEKQINENKFSDIPKLETPPVFINPGVSLDSDSLGTIYKLSADKTQNKNLFVLFEMPMSEYNYRSDFISYLKQVIYEGSDNALSHSLKQENLITSMSVGMFQQNNQYVIIGCEFDLTDKGYSQVDDVLKSYFSFIKQLESKFDTNNFSEKGKLEFLLFQYNPNDISDMKDLSYFAEFINYFNDKPEEVLIDNQYKEYDEKIFSDIFKRIGDPLQSVIILQSNTFEETEKIDSRFFASINKQFDTDLEQFKTQYSKIVKLTKEDSEYLIGQSSLNQLSFIISLDLSFAPTSGKVDFYQPNKDDSKSINSLVKIDFNLPEESNEVLFSVTNSEYTKDPYKVKEIGESWKKFIFTESLWSKRLESEDIENMPLLLVQNDYLKSFYMLDKDQGIPQSVFKMRLYNRNIGQYSKEKQLFMQVFLDAQNFYIQDKFSKEVNGKFQESSSFSNQDLEISVMGWREKIQDVSLRIMDSLKTHVPNEEEWKVSSSNVQQNLEQENLNKSILQILTRYKKSEFLDLSSFIVPQKLELIEQIKSMSQKDISDNVSKLYDHTNIELLFSGNMSPQESILMTQEIQKVIGDPQDTNKEKPIQEITNFSQQSFVYQQKNPNEDDANSAIFNVYQIGETTLEQKIYLNMLSERLEIHFYQYLRSDRGLGYIAGSQIFNLGCIQHVGVYLQGDKKQPNEINKIIEKAFRQFAKKIHHLSQDEFDTQLNSMKSLYEKDSTDFSERYTSAWSQIERELYNFDMRLYALNEIINSVTLKGLKHFFKESFQKNGSKFSFQIYSQTSSFDNQDLSMKTLATNLRDKEPILIESLEDLQKKNPNPNYQCKYTL